MRTTILHTHTDVIDAHFSRLHTRNFVAFPGCDFIRFDTTFLFVLERNFAQEIIFGPMKTATQASVTLVA